jgi:hypothetical protein
MDNRVYEMQRLKYWQGQKLLSRDFRDQTSYEAQLRWWHNRALHNAYGVSYGFAVTLVDTRVRIDCGVAYDCYGRELILQAPRELELPEPGNDFASMILVASFDTGDRSISSKEMLMGASGCSSRSIGPWIYWKPSADFHFTEGIALAEISYEPSAHLESLPANVRIPVALSQRIFFDSERKLLIAIDGLKTTPDEAAKLKALSNEATYAAAIDKLVAKAERSPVLDARLIVRRARGFTRPRIGSGATVPGDTAWELWTETIINARGVKTEADLGVQVTIDTSGAGFTQAPCYFAWVEGTLWNQIHLNFFPVPIIHIDHETTRRFRLRLWMPSIITVLGGRIRYANIDANLEQKGVPPPSPLLNTIVSSILGTSPGTSDGVAAAVSTTAPSPPTYKTERSFVTDFVNFARQQKLYVCWMGIQEMVKPACEPFPSCECLTTVPEPKPPVQQVAKPPKRSRGTITQLPLTLTKELLVGFLNLKKDKP